MAISNRVVEEGDSVCGHSSYGVLYNSYGA